MAVVVSRCIPALALALAACGSDSTGPIITTVTVSGASGTVAVGGTLQLTATARDGDGNVVTGQQPEWSSSAAGTATVGAGGLVTGVGVGTARISASIAGRTGGLDLTVTPPPVTSITVSPAAPSVEVNSTVQLTATTRGADGAELTGRPVSWSSGNESVATVDGTGLALGLTPGTADITALSEGVSTSVPLMVTAPPGSLVVTAITPAELIEGGSATIMGAGFSASPSGNTVTIDGVAATVTSASATSLTISVPAGTCMPARNDAIISVTVGTQSAARNHPARPAAFTDLPVGQLTLLSNPADFCIQFDASTTSTSYVIGVQSVSATGTSRTPVRVRGRAAGAAGPSLAGIRFDEAASGSLVYDNAALQRAARLERHRAAELDIRRQEQELAPRFLAAARRQSAGGTLGTSALQVPADAEPGDTVTVKVPDRADVCAQFTTITAVVRHRGMRGIFIEDVANPAGGFTSEDYATLSAILDNGIWDTNTTYFGEPTDLDGNGRIVIVVTREVNSTANLLGFVSTADFFTDQCAAANGGEYYYGIAPDPNGTAGSVYTIEDALLDGPPLIAHEFTHIIQIGRRLFLTPGATDLQTVWELEGQATFAQEVNGHAFTGNSTGQNYGFATAFNNPATEPIAWYAPGFADLAYYYGYDNEGPSNVGNAPEQCGWLARPTDADDMGPCGGTRHVYGVSWSFLRWLSDQYGPGHAGGEAGLHRALVGHTQSGFSTIASVIGRPIDELLAHWAAALFTDDRYAGLDARLGFMSWNMTGIYNSLVQPARLTPRTRAFAAFTDDVTVIAGSSAYFVVNGASRPAASLSFLTQAGDPLPATTRVWIVRTQ